MWNMTLRATLTIFSSLCLEQKNAKTHLQMYSAHIQRSETENLVHYLHQTSAILD
uniref:Uncharacterized protein n=2 Tax=Anguilla anguilla TaxID=7936 RepID=A0A0E9UE30_ANGAN